MSMRFCKRVSFGILSAFLLSAGRLPDAHADDPPAQPPPTLSAGGVTWIVGEAEPISGPHLLHKPVFAPDGSGLLTVQSRRPLLPIVRPEDKSEDNDISIVYWNRLTRQSNTVWRYHCLPGETLDVYLDGWFGNATYASIRTIHTTIGSDGKRQTLTGYHILNTRTGILRSADLPPGSSVSEAISPAGNRIALPVTGVGAAADSASVVLLDLDCRIVRTIPLPDREKSCLIEGIWVDDKTYKAIRVELSEENPEKYAVVFYDIDFAKGAAQRDRNYRAPFPLPTALSEFPEDPPFPFTLQTEADTQHPNTPGLKNTWLVSADKVQGESTTKRILLAGDAEGLRIVGVKDGYMGAVYKTHGTLMYAPLLRLRQ